MGWHAPDFGSSEHQQLASCGLNYFGDGLWLQPLWICSLDVTPPEGPDTVQPFVLRLKRRKWEISWNDVFQFSSDIGVLLVITIYFLIVCHLYNSGKVQMFYQGWKSLRHGDRRAEISFTHLNQFYSVSYSYPYFKASLRGPRNYLMDERRQILAFLSFL